MFEYGFGRRAGLSPPMQTGISFLSPLNQAPPASKLTQRRFMASGLNSARTILADSYFENG